MFVRRGLPAYIRSDNGAEFTANAVRGWLTRLGVRTLYIERGSPWENGYVESFIGKLRDELLNGEIFYTLTEAKVLVERWRQLYNRVRPHSALGYRPPAPEAIEPMPPGWTAPGLLDTRVRVFDLMRPPQLERVFPALPGPAFGSRSPRESNDGYTGS